MSGDYPKVPERYAHTWRTLSKGATRGVANRVNEARFATSPIGLIVAFTCATYGSRPTGSRLGTRHWSSVEIAPDERLEELSRSLQKGPSRSFDVEERAVVHRSFQATCARLGCELDALNVRREHIHLVALLPAGLTAAEFMKAAKLDSTERLRDSGANGEFVWAKSYVPSLVLSIERWFRAVRYAICEQGENDYLPYPLARPYNNRGLIAKRRRFFDELGRVSIETRER